MMLDPELAEVLTSMKDSIDLLVLKVSNLEDRTKITEDAVKGLETEFITKIYEPAQKAFDEAVDAENFRVFSEKYGDKLSPYVEPLRAVEGEDFDFVRKAYDEFNGLEDKSVTSDDFIDKFVANVEVQLQNIREKLGATEVEAKVTADGEVEIKADGEEVAKEETVTPAEVQEAIDQVTPDEAEEIADAVLDSPEEIAAFERELAASLKK